MSHSSNPLCTLEECTHGFGCGHRGPRGQACFFDHEKQLCELLHVQWAQHVTFEQLCDMLRSKLDAAPLEPPEGMMEKLSAHMASLPKLVRGGE